MRHTLRASTLIAALVFSAVVAVQAADDSKPKPVKPCTITSPNSGSFYNLNSLMLQASVDGKPSHNESWHARGYDYGANFTLNFCGPVVEKLKDVEGVSERLQSNVSAFYQRDGKTYSIGQMSTEPVFRGRKLVLNYTMGSPCDSNPKHKRKNSDDDDDEDKDRGKGDKDDDKKNEKEGSGTVRRKSTIISLLCDQSPTALAATVAFVGATDDECAYFFEVRSAAACAGVTTDPQAVGPAGVFGIIVLIALAAYLFGGIAYQRTVMHQRGLRQLPNYSLWAGVASFLKDVIIILTSSCARFVPRRRGYNQLPTHASSGSIGRGRTSTRSNEDENRLIDQLDEEWDD